MRRCHPGVVWIVAWVAWAHAAQDLLAMAVLGVEYASYSSGYTDLW